MLSRRESEYEEDLVLPPVPADPAGAIAVVAASAVADAAVAADSTVRSLKPLQEQKTAAQSFELETLLVHVG